MTDQSGGQTPAGWYPDGSGNVRYWDGSAWTEHIQPDPAAAAPAAPATPAAPAEPAAAATPPLTVGEAAATAGQGLPATAGATPVAAAYPGQAGTGVPQAEPVPFYKKPLALVAIAVVALLVIGGAAFALSGGDDDSGNTAGGTGTPTTAAPAATTATQTYTLNCEPHGMITGSNAQYPFDITMTVTPAAITVSTKGSIKNTGPTTIEAGAYRFDAAVTVNGTPLALTGPTNKATASGDPKTNAGSKEEQPIFKDDEQPLVATAANPVTAGTPTVVLQDIYFNQVTGSGTAATTDVFDARCNASPEPNKTPAPIGLSVPPGVGGPASVAPSVASSVTP